MADTSSTPAVEYRILGGVDMVVDARRLAVAGSIRRGLLGYLVLNTGRTLTLNQIVGALWGERPPATAPAQVHAAVSAIRQVLRSAGAGPDLVTRSPGYGLTVEVGCTDLGRFQSLLAQARSGDGTPVAERARLLEEALRCWRGEALADAAGDFRQRTVAVLEQQRIGAVEDLNDARLALGQHRQLLAGLQALVAEYPLRERPWAQLMTALYLSDRQAEALACYRELRERLACEHGIDPLPSLTDLHQRILNADPSLVEPLVAPLAARDVRPGQLPPDTADFTGREHVVEQLCGRLTPGRERTTVPTCVVAGAAGVGKTTLAVRVAHLVREAFPDGQLYADLDGVGGTPMPPGQVLDMFLRALGVTGDALPPSDSERTALLRSTLAGRRVLLVLDNAADAGQVRPLLPGAATCAVLITGRHPIITIPGADRLILDVFNAAEAVEFLGRLMSGALNGPPIAAVDGDEALAELATLCGNLPLALRIAGARAGGGLGESPRSIADRLADQRYRLSELEIDDLSVRASLELSHQLLHGRPGGAAAVRAFRRLGLLDGPDISLDVAAQLGGESADRTRRTLEVLVHAQFLRSEPAERPDRYRMHTLVRLYARERALADEPISETRAAVQRVLHHYLTIAREAGPLVQPAVEVSLPMAGPPRLHSRDQALAWFDAERAGILSALRFATAAASDDTADDTTADTVVVAELVLALRWLFRSHGYDEQWQWALQTALRRASRCGAEALTVGLTSELASLHGWRGDHDAQIALELENLRAWRAADNRLNEIRALNNLGVAFHRRQALGEAVDYYRRALSAARAEGSQRFEAYLLANLAAVHRDAGRHDEAIRHDTQALQLCRAAGDRHAQVDVTDDLALSHRAAGRYDEAIAAYRQAVAIAGELQDRPRRQVALRGLGETHLVAGDPKAARGILEQARADAADAGDGYGEGLAWWHLGTSHAAIGEPERARRCWQRAAPLLCDADAPEAATVKALLGTLDTQHDAPDVATPGGGRS